MKKKNPLISIIVPVYNISQYVERCIKSIVKQTYRNIQIIIVDDGSTDDSGYICDKLAKQDKRMSVYHTKNRGLVEARKEGLLHADGEYIGFVDGDDYIETTMYETLLSNILETDADFVHSIFIEERNNVGSIIAQVPTTILDLQTQDEHIELIVKYIFEKYEGFYISPSIWSKLFKNEFIKKCYELVPDEQQYGEDVLCLYHCLIRAKRISLLNSAYYHYVVRDKSLSHKDTQSTFFNEINLSHYIIKLLSDYNYMNGIKEKFCTYIKHKMMGLLESVAEGELHITKYYYKNVKSLFGKRIVLYGAGKVGRDYYAQICKYKRCEIVAWIDANWDNIKLDYGQVQSISRIKEYSFDKVLIAIEKEDAAENIHKYLENIGIDQDKIIWDKPLNY